MTVLKQNEFKEQFSSSVRLYFIKALNAERRAYSLSSERVGVLPLPLPLLLVEGPGLGFLLERAGVGLRVLDLRRLVVMHVECVHVEVGALSWCWGWLLGPYQ